MDTSLTYGQLLALPEWQEKRLKIINRDKLICQKCNNTSYQKDNFYGPYLQIVANEKFPFGSFHSFSGKTEKVFANDENGTKLIPKHEKVMLYYSRHRSSGLQEVPAEGFFVAAARILTKEELIHYFPSENPDLTPEDKLKLMREMIKRLLGKTEEVQNIPEKKDLIKTPLTELKWIFAKDLNVHHTYYQIDKLPWEYPNDSLQTLCRSCHEKVHEEEIIPVRDATGIKIGNYKPCSRCHGAGWFPEYSHVQNGICFKCRGVKYLSNKFIIKD